MDEIWTFELLLALQRSASLLNLGTSVCHLYSFETVPLTKL